MRILKLKLQSRHAHTVLKSRRMCRERFRDLHCLHLSPARVATDWPAGLIGQLWCQAAIVIQASGFKFSLDPARDFASRFGYPNRTFPTLRDSGPGLKCHDYGRITF
jgi:hypothetical protein